MWGYPWTTLGVLLASAGFRIASIISDIKHSLLTLVLIAISYPVYFFAVNGGPAHSSGPDIPILKEVKAEYTEKKVCKTPTASPEVGIFGLINGKLLIDRTPPLSESESCADHQTHPGSHSDTWERHVIMRLYLH
ncbi:MAG: hypothetical protein WA172_05535 [Terriglobales bacterium]